VLSVKEDRLNNRQQHLDVTCFPIFFPTGKFGEYHPRGKLSNSEYIKSQLYNKDSRFRKNPQCVFYLPWQKEMGELSTGVYNLLKSTSRQHMSVCSLLDKEETSDDANLCTVGSWYKAVSTGFSGKVNWGAWFKSGFHLLSHFQLCWIRIPRHCKLSQKCKQCFFQLWHWEALHRGPNICFYKIF